MPIYEYECKQCGERFEELVFGDETPSCPKCSAANAEKLLSCSCFKMPGNGGMSAPASSNGKSCAGCSGGNCSSCG